MKNKRNNNIDFLRGIAVLSIILINTTWWSGKSYLPAWFQNLTLIFDVPIFIFLSGLSFNYVNSITKNLQILINHWKKWLYFLVFYTLILLIFFKTKLNMEEILQWIVYIFPKENSLPVVKGSIWFIQMYIPVTIISSLIICGVNHYSKEKEKTQNLKTIIIFLLLSFIAASSPLNKLPILNYITFYTFVYFLGYLSSAQKLENIKQFITLETITLGITIFLFLSLNLSITSIQNIKFPPTIAYLPFSMLSIILIWYLKDKLSIKEKNPMNYIGRNAIFFYFSGSVSASILLLLESNITIANIPLKFLILLILNLLITSLGAILLIKSYSLFTSKEFIKAIKENKLIKKINLQKIKYPLIIFALIIIFLITNITTYTITKKETNKKEEKTIETEVDYKTENIVFLGDSITAMYSIKEFYQDLPIINSGISGWKTTDVYNDLENKVYQYNPTKVFLLIGTNDLTTKDKEEIINKIIDIVESIKKNRPNTKLYVESIYPVNNKTDNDIVNIRMVGKRSNEKIQAINKKLEKLSDEVGYTYINLYPKLTNEDGDLKLKYTTDGLHLSKEGYEIVTRERMKYIETPKLKTN